MLRPDPLGRRSRRSRSSCLVPRSTFYLGPRRHRSHGLLEMIDRKVVPSKVVLPGEAGEGIALANKAGVYEGRKPSLTARQ
jgi:hypothetical protein